MLFFFSRITIMQSIYSWSTIFFENDSLLRHFVFFPKTKSWMKKNIILSSFHATCNQHSIFNESINELIISDSGTLLSHHAYRFTTSNTNWVDTYPGFTLVSHRRPHATLDLGDHFITRVYDFERLSLTTLFKLVPKVVLRATQKQAS